MKSLAYRRRRTMWIYNELRTIFSFIAQTTLPFFLGVIHSLSSGISYRIPNTSDNLFPKEHLNKINGKM